MRPRPTEPPARTRLEVTSAERDAITAVLGPMPASLLAPIRDARGQRFQRLEFLGDSVLDLVVVVHLLVEPRCRACTGLDGNIGRLVTDHALAERAEAAGLGAWLEWQASPERRADLVEACVAACWLAGGWPQAADLIDLVVHPLGAGVTAILTTGEGGAVSAGNPRTQRRAGAAVLELAASRRVFDELPTADEGALSHRRAQLHRAARVADYARRHHLSRGGPDSVASDVVESQLATTLLRDGADAALADADVVLG